MGGTPLLVAAIISGAFLVGMLPALVEVFRSALRPHLNLDEKTLRRPDWWFLGAYIVGFLASGILVDKVGVKTVFFGGALITALGLASIALSQNVRAAILSLIGVGLAHACFTTACLYLMPHPWDQPRSLVQRMNLGFTVVGLGVLVAPLVGMLLSVQFRPRLLVLSLLFIVPATLISILDHHELPHQDAEWNLADFIFEPRLLMAAVITFLFCPLEGSLGTWARSYLEELRFSPRKVAMLMLAYWTLFLASRFGAGVFLSAGREMWLVLALALLAAMIFGNLRGAFEPGSAALAFVLVGAVTGPILPTVLGVGLTLSPSEPATVLSGLLAVGTIGNALFQPPLRKFANSHSVRITLRIPMLHALILAVPVLILALIRD